MLFCLCLCIVEFSPKWRVLKPNVAFLFRRMFNVYRGVDLCFIYYYALFILSFFMLTQRFWNGVIYWVSFGFLLPAPPSLINSSRFFPLSLRRTCFKISVSTVFSTALKNNSLKTNISTIFFLCLVVCFYIFNRVNHCSALWL